MSKDPFTTVRIYEEDWALVGRIAEKSGESKARIIKRLVESEARFYGINPQTVWEEIDGFVVSTKHPDVRIKLDEKAGLMMGPAFGQLMLNGEFDSAIGLIDFIKDYLRGKGF